MALSLFDHHQRLHDLEVLLGALAETFAMAPDNRELLEEVSRKLRARGAPRAAELLTGDRRSAPYRR